MKTRYLKLTIGICLIVLSIAIISGCSIEKILGKSTEYLTNGEYTFRTDTNEDPKPSSGYGYRPRGRQNGVWMDVYISKVVVDDEYLTFFFERTPTSLVDNGYDATINWDHMHPFNHPLLTNLDDEDEVVRATGRTGHGSGNITSVIFPRIDTMRFRMTRGSGDYMMVFSEINLKKAVYKKTN